MWILYPKYMCFNLSRTYLILFLMIISTERVHYPFIRCERVQTSCKLTNKAIEMQQGYYVRRMRPQRAADHQRYEVHIRLYSTVVHTGHMIGSCF